jgi:integrase/recombinase XerD
MAKRKAMKIPEFLTVDEQDRILSLFADDSPVSIRNRAIVRLFLDTGLRTSELIDLKHRDVDLTTGRLWVRQGKNSKDRGLFFNGSSNTALKAWLTVKPGEHKPSDNLFTSLDGRKPLCGRYIRRMVAQIGEKAGVEKRCHPHIFRHSFGTRLLRQEKNLFLLSKALGHANLSSTQIYLHLEDSELETAMKRLGDTQ